MRYLALRKNFLAVLSVIFAVLSFLVCGPASAASKSDATYAWHTIYGSDLEDTGHGIAADNSGNTYVTGHSGASWNGPNGESPLHPHSGEGDTFIMKLNSKGAYQWHTFYPSHGDDINSSIAVDEDGNSYVAWVTVGDPWNGPSGQAPLSTVEDMSAALTVLRLDTNGGYKWHTFYGEHNGGVWAHGIAAGSHNDVYVLATTGNVDWHAESPLHPCSEGTGSNQAILKLDRDGKYQWHTFYGSGWTGYGFEAAHGMVVDKDSNIYITANNNAAWTGPDGQAPLNAFEGADGNSDEIMVLKLNSSGAYQWHTFYGTYSDESDMDNSIAIDGSGNIYITGHTGEEGQWKVPDGKEPLHPQNGSDYNLFVLKLDGNGSYQWHTFYPGLYPGYSVAADGGGNVYIAGYDGSWEGSNGESPLHVTGGLSLMLLKLTTDGAYQWHTFYGSSGTGEVYGFAVAADKWGDLHVTGRTDTTWTSPDGESPLHNYGDGNYDTFVVKVINCAASLSNPDLILHVPAVPADGQIYWGDLQYSAASGHFNLSSAGLVSDPLDFAKCAPSTISSEDGNLFLNVPDILVNGTSLWGKFLYTGNAFLLHDYGLN